MSLHLLYTSDMHNRLEPLARIPQLLRSDSLLLDGGDALAGSNTVFRWEEPALVRMGRLGYRAMAMGNREFSYFRWVLRWREQERPFPLLACNLQDLRQRQQDWRSWVELPEHRAIVVGVTPVQYPVGSAWERLTGFRFLDPANCLPPLLEELRPRARHLIVLSHLGLKVDLQLAERGLAADLILGGHSHDLTPLPLRRGGLMLVHPGSHGRYLAELEHCPQRGCWEGRMHACR